MKTKLLTLLLASALMSISPLSHARDIRIGVSLQNMKNEYTIAMSDSLRTRSKSLGVTLLERDGQGIVETQIKDVENFITQKVDAIVLNPVNQVGCAQAVERAVAANIPIILVNLQVVNQQKASAFVGSDDVEAGRIEMQHVAEIIRGKGNIAILRGTQGSSADDQRMIGIREVLQHYPDIQIIAEQAANWDRLQAFRIAENWLMAGKKLDAIVAQNDEMALGALRAFGSVKRKIPIIGIDTIPDALRALRDGRLAATVFQNAHAQGVLAIDIAKKLANSEPVQKTTLIPFRLVTAANLEQLVR